MDRRTSGNPRPSADLAIRERIIELVLYVFLDATSSSTTSPRVAPRSNEPRVIFPSSGAP